MNLIGMRGTPKEFGVFAAVGTWTDGEECAKCGFSTEDLVAPLQIEWEEVGKTSADFVWDGGFLVAVNSRVREWMKRQNYPCRFSAVKRVQWKRRGAGKSYVEDLPWIGQRLFWLRPTESVDLDEKASRVKVRKKCSVCGKAASKFKTSGLVVSTKSIGQTPIFRIRQFEPSDATFVTEAAKREIENAGFSNISFKLAGRIA